MMQETSYGIIPLTRMHGEWHILLICHSKGKFWAFPKGHSEQGEKPKEAAARELYEETGLTIKHILKEESLQESYNFIRESATIRKTVFYFLAEVNGKLKLQTSEVSDAKWVKLSEASQMITFPESRNLVEQVKFILKPGIAQSQV